MSTTLARRLAAAVTAFRRAGAGENLPPSPPPHASSIEEPAALSEALGINIDGDDDLFRPITGNAKRDLSPLTQRRMREIAYYLWRANPLGNRSIELPLAYILAEGIKLTVDDEDSQSALNRFWRDPINKMTINFTKMARELALYGEQCWPTFVNDMNGHVRLGYLDPDDIAQVVRDPDNGRQVIGIVTRRDGKGRYRKFRVIVNGADADLFSARTIAIRQGDFTDGECFYFTINDLQNGNGHSDLLPVADFIDGYDQFLFTELERFQLSRSTVWDVTLKGANQAQVNERAGKIQPPKAGGIRVHNDSEVWNLLAADLGAYDSAQGARLFRNHALGGGTIPEHWFGGGGDVNRSTGDSMSDATFKVFSNRQTILKYILEEMGTYVVRQRHLAFHGKDIDPENAEFQVRAEFPEMIAKDTTRYAAALQQVVAAAVAALRENLITAELAVRFIQSVASRLGVDFDAKDELEKAVNESEEDGFPPPPAANQTMPPEEAGPVSEVPDPEAKP